jgi:hypothetical protein
MCEKEALPGKACTDFAPPCALPEMQPSGSEAGGPGKPPLIIVPLSHYQQPFWQL